MTEHAKALAADGEKVLDGTSPPTEDEIAAFETAKDEGTVNEHIADHLATVDEWRERNWLDRD